MKGALLAADSIVTVSETYAWEITRPEHGVGLHSILQARHNCLVGILNGMDTATWDPATDVHLGHNYSPEDLTGKARCKAELRRKLGLPEAEYGVDVPLLGFVGRLDPQKGPDIIISALSGLLALDCQVFILCCSVSLSSVWCLLLGRNKTRLQCLPRQDKLSRCCVVSTFFSSCHPFIVAH
jgi:starch synthase